MPDAVAACEVWFYRLERSPLYEVLPELLERTLARGWRALVRTSSPERVEQLDAWLWRWKPDSFLPHGAAGGERDALQPILVSTGAERPNEAQALFVVDGAEPGPLEGLERCISLFDGTDEAELAASRRRWREVKAAGHPVSYWRQAERGWEKQA